MRDRNKQIKMADVNLRFEMSIKSTLNGFVLQMLRSRFVEITSCIYTKSRILFNLGE